MLPISPDPSLFDKIINREDDEGGKEDGIQKETTNLQEGDPNGEI